MRSQRSSSGNANSSRIRPTSLAEHVERTEQGLDTKANLKRLIAQRDAAKGAGMKAALTKKIKAMEAELGS
jgi:hypothetical protein